MLWKNKKKKADGMDLKAFEQRLDEKIALLKLLEEKADKKIESLERLLYAAAGPDGAGKRQNQNREDEILALSEKGIDRLEIARILSVPAGEVELILDLHKK